MIFPQIKEAIKPGSVLGSSYTVKDYGTSRDGEQALVYSIRQRSSSLGKPSEKRVAESEWEQAHARLLETGEFSRAWFTKTIRSAREAPCNFTVIGQVFVLLGIADDYQRGKYVGRRQVKA